MSNIKQAEVWLVRLNPTVGAEMRKERPVVVLSADTVGTLCTYYGLAKFV
jgi:mRNA interferase MazF